MEYTLTPCPIFWDHLRDRLGTVLCPSWHERDRTLLIGDAAHVIHPIAGQGLNIALRDVAVLAEVGVVLLLFEIGLEVSLAQVIRLRSTIVLGGTMQIGITVVATWVIGMLLDIPPNQAVALGCLFALSSTAIVLKSYRDRGELDSPHGRVSLAILLFQDLMIVPLIVLIQVLGNSGGDGEFRDLALIDVALSRERFVATRAIWDINTIYEVFLTRAEPASIGLSSIGARLEPVSSTDEGGLHYILAGADGLGKAAGDPSDDRRRA